MKNFNIKAKLILLFILIKVIPLLLISFIAYEGVVKLEDYLKDSTKFLFNENKQIILNTANASIEDSIKNLDKKSQIALERQSYEIAKSVANFLYERDKDILFLSKLNLSQNTLENFYNSKNKEIVLHEDYAYDDKSNSWESTKAPLKIERPNKNANLRDNEKEFNFTDPYKYEYENRPIYKEINYFDLNGNEIYKVSQINKKLLNLKNKKNTYINSEDYFNEISNLKKGEIYVSDVIGEYVPSKVIGTFTKEKASKSGIAFEPEKYAYAGKENPVGKKFEGIIRFITPVFKDNKKVGYISLALDHEHVMQFTDTSDPTGDHALTNISDASKGNYAFMWDYEGKNISHPRDYFIVGYDKNTGNRAMPWLSADIAKKYKESNLEINEFLEKYPTFEEQSLNKKPNIAQLKETGNLGLDCRYLNFAPQCEGWMQLTENGGYGSFIIFWSKVWKLTTAATIPYYTGKYKNSKRGFGFVTIGANVDEFHAAANETKRNVTKILNQQTEKMKKNVDENKSQVNEFIQSLINELSIVTLIMIIIIIGIAIWVSNYITSKINNLLVGTQKFANKELNYRIKVSSKDEIGNLESSFNNMASEINNLIEKQNELNEHLESKVEEKTKELTQINQNLEEEVEYRTKSLKNALIKAENADRVKTTFLANMSHEIRTPLNSIIGFSQVLATSSSLDEKNIKYASIIESSAKSLLGIINDILDISKIESGNFEIALKEANVHEIGEHVFELFNNRASDKKINLVYNIDKNIPSCLITDGVRVRQVLSNLISNAVKFTPELGKIEFNISLLENRHSKATLRFSVKDSGIGIPEDKLNNIFQPFIQVDNETNRQYEGTGLGLSISSHIISSLDSKIIVESSIGNGSTFYFDLNLDVCAKNLDRKTKADLTNISTFNGNILVAEDNPANQELVKYILDTFEVTYKIVSNGKEAIDAYKENSNFDLILMDINMPILDGISAFQEIIEYERINNLKHTPISALTANAIKGDKEKFLNLGMDYYLSKPLDLDKLRTLFSKYLSAKDIKTDTPTLKEESTLEKVTAKSVADNLGLPEMIGQKLLDKFIADINKDLEELKALIEKEDPEQIRQKAHYIKNSCLNINLSSATNLLQFIENSSSEKSELLLKKFNSLSKIIKFAI